MSEVTQGWEAQGSGVILGMAAGTAAAQLRVKPSLSCEGRPAGQPGTAHWPEN